MLIRFMIALGAMGLSGCASPVATAADCDLSPPDRPLSISGFTDLAEACLAIPPGETVFESVKEDEIADLINAARREAGLPALSVRAALLPPARFHSLDIIWTGAIAHDGAAGRTPFDRIAALDRTLIRSSAAENVAMISGDYDPTTVGPIIHSLLMDSPGHRANILSGDATHMAVGVARLSDGWVATQLFVKVEGELSRPLNAEASPNDIQGVNLIGDWSLHNVSFDANEPNPHAFGIADDETEPARLVVTARQSMPGGYTQIGFMGPDADVAIGSTAGENAPSP